MRPEALCRLHSRTNPSPRVSIGDLPPVSVPAPLANIQDLRPTAMPHHTTVSRVWLLAYLSERGPATHSRRRRVARCLDAGSPRVPMAVRPYWPRITFMPSRMFQLGPRQTGVAGAFQQRIRHCGDSSPRWLELTGIVPPHSPLHGYIHLCCLRPCFSE
jgi:hypothetical protein